MNWSDFWCLFHYRKKHLRDNKLRCPDCVKQ